MGKIRTSTSAMYIIYGAGINNKRRHGKYVWDTLHPLTERGLTIAAWQKAERKQIILTYTGGVARSAHRRHLFQQFYSFD